ncbi:hypothetical protein V7x_49920 [Crateriforma conspicua]|uniref:Uncharacterized protein n=1 Tax=Crateriforma conspicua TaxID=2527996 RepID=A0A5C6FPS6_9PLAN|nr:hypothetical protein V7x_49920 [Crateriforma conspicua]
MKFLSRPGADVFGSQVRCVRKFLSVVAERNCFTVPHRGRVGIEERDSGEGFLAGAPSPRLGLTVQEGG